MSSSSASTEIRTLKGVTCAALYKEFMERGQNLPVLSNSDRLCANLAVKWLQAFETNDEHKKLLPDALGEESSQASPGERVRLVQQLEDLDC